MKRGFTLIELIVVIIIIGILATLGFTQYTKVVEKGRSAEAKAILGTLRSAEVAYNLEKGSGYGILSTTVNDLPVEAPTACTKTHYFSYACATTGTCTATRCTASGKTPNFTGTAYTITLTQDGVWDGTPGYY